VTRTLWRTIGRVQPETRRLVITIVVMTALMGLTLSFLTTVRERGMTDDFFAQWFARFLGTYVMVVPVVLVVSPVAQRITELVDGKIAGWIATAGPRPPADR
jgi:hypothetical protein